MLPVGGRLHGRRGAPRVESTETGLEAALRTIKEPTPSRALSTFGIRSVSAERGRSTSVMRCDRAFADAEGHVPMGAVAMLADSVLARTLLTCMPAGLVVVTGRGRVSMIGAAPAGAELTAHGAAVAWNLDSGVVTAEIEDRCGSAVARAEARCFTVPGQLGSAMGPVDGWAAESRPVNPVNGFLGLEWFSESEAEGTVSAFLTGTERLESMYGSVHGGATAAILEATLARAAAHRATAPLDLEIHYLRPVPAGSAGLRARGRVIHSTRRFTVCAGEILDAGGRVLATATASYGPRRGASA